MNEILIEIKLTVRDIYEFQKSFLFRRLTFKQCLVLYGLFAVFCRHSNCHRWVV